jgi:hypothetical protein
VRYFLGKIAAKLKGGPESVDLLSCERPDCNEDSSQTWGYDHLAFDPRRKRPLFTQKSAEYFNKSLLELWCGAGPSRC